MSNLLEGLSLEREEELNIYSLTKRKLEGVGRGEGEPDKYFKSVITAEPGGGLFRTIQGDLARPERSIPFSLRLLGARDPFPLTVVCGNTLWRGKSTLHLLRGHFLSTSASAGPTISHSDEHKHDQTSSNASYGLVIGAPH